MDVDGYTWCIQNIGYFHQCIDPIAIANELRKHEIITQPEIHFLMRLKERSDIWRRLIFIIRPKCTFGTFLDVIETCGYPLHFRRNELTVIGKSCCKNESRKFAQRLLVNLKTQTHNGIFGNPREYLSKLSFTYYQKFISETDFYRKQTIADRYASVICAEIDSYVMLYKDSGITTKKLRKLKALVPHTSNSCVTLVAYNARRAIREALAGNLTQADDYIQISKVDSFNVEACVEVENMLYIQVFNLMTRYDAEPSVKLRDEILAISDEGLQILEDEEESSKQFWRRMFLIRMTFCLFGLSMKFHRIPGCYIDLEAIKRGKKYLAEIDKCWSGIEIRRKIWYFVARARQHELDCNPTSIETALWYIDQAIQCARQGNFSELNFALEYKKGIVSNRDALIGNKFDISDSYYSNAISHSESTRSDPLSTEVRKPVVVSHSYYSNAISHSESTRSDPLSTEIRKPVVVSDSYCSNAISHSESTWSDPLSTELSKPVESTESASHVFSCVHTIRNNPKRLAQSKYVPYEWQKSAEKTLFFSSILKNSERLLYSVEDSMNSTANDENILVTKAPFKDKCTFLSTTTIPSIPLGSGQQLTDFNNLNLMSYINTGTAQENMEPIEFSSQENGIYSMNNDPDTIFPSFLSSDLCNVKYRVDNVLHRAATTDSISFEILEPSFIYSNSIGGKEHGWEFDTTHMSVQSLFDQSTYSLENDSVKSSSIFNIKYDNSSDVTGHGGIETKEDIFISEQFTEEDGDSLDNITFKLTTSLFHSDLRRDNIQPVEHSCFEWVDTPPTKES